MFYSVDRIAEDTVMLIGADGSQLAVGCEWFERVPCEGDIVALNGGTYVVDESATQEKREQANELLRRLLNREE